MLFFTSSYKKVLDVYARVNVQFLYFSSMSVCQFVLFHYQIVKKFQNMFEQILNFYLLNFRVF